VWVRRAPGEPLRRYPVTLARTHPLLVGVSVAAVLVVAVLGPATVVGPAYAPQGRFTLPLDAMWNYLGHWTAQLTVSTGYLPMIIGAPWLLRELVRPRSPETGTFAAVALGLFAVWVYLTANHGTQLEERYVAVLGALPVIAFGAAIVRREAWPLGTLIVGALVARAVVAKGVSGLPGEDAFAFFIAPGRLFYDHVLINRATTILPFGDEHAGTVIMVGVLAVAVAATVLVMRRRGTAPVAGVLAAVFVVCAVTGAYCLGRYTPATQPERSLYGSAWIERATRGEPTVLWAYDTPETVGGRRYLIQLASFFNANTCCGFWLADLPVLLGEGGEVPARRDDAEPTHLVRFTGFHPLVFASRTVQRSTYLGHLELRVERPTDLPLRAAARIEGTDPDGRLDPGGRATVTYLPAGREPGRCLDMEVLSAPGAQRPVPYRVTGGGRTVAGTVADGRPRVVTVPVGDGGRATVAVPRSSPDRLGLGESRIRPCRG